MTTRDSMGLIGSKGLLRESRGMAHMVQIIDVKTAWGRTRFLVKPIEGVGEAWIEAESADHILGDG